MLQTCMQRGKTISAGKAIRLTLILSLIKDVYLAFRTVALHVERCAVNLFVYLMIHKEILKAVCQREDFSAWFLHLKFIFSMESSLLIEELMIC